MANWQRVVQFRAWAIEWAFNWQAWERGRAPPRRDPMIKNSLSGGKKVTPGRLTEKPKPSDSCVASAFWSRFTGAAILNWPGDWDWDWDGGWRMEDGMRRGVWLELGFGRRQLGIHSVMGSSTWLKISHLIKHRGQEIQLPVSSSPGPLSMLSLLFFHLFQLCEPNFVYFRMLSTQLQLFNQNWCTQMARTTAA